MIKYFIENIERFYTVLESLIKDRNIDKTWLEDLYNIFTLKDNQYTTPIKYHLFLAIRDNPEYLDVDLLSKVLNLSEDQVLNIFSNEGYKVYFPVYDLTNETSTVATAFIVENTDLTLSFNEFVNLDLIKQLTNKNFFVIFDRPFTGESYQLALVAGLIAKDKSLLEKLAFTGAITSSGRVKIVNHIQEKEKACQELGLTLITPKDIQSVEELDFWLNSPDIPVIYLNRNTTNDLEISLKKIEELIQEKYKHFKIENLLKFYNLSKEDLYHITENVNFSDKETLIEILNQAEEKFKKLFAVKNAVLYISITISSLAFLIGSLIGSRKRAVILHYANSSYKVVIDLSENTRIIKQQTDKFEIIQPQECEPSEEMALILYIASHNPIQMVTEYIKQNLPTVKSICSVKTVNQGNLELQFFLRTHQELYTFINSVVKKKIHLFYSIPTPIALTLGMAIEHFWDITLYHYDKMSGYIKIPVNLNEVVSKF